MYYERSRGSNNRQAPDLELARLAARQHGLVTSAQLAAAGLTRAAISNRAAAGRLHPLYRGVYGQGHSRLSQEGRWLAAVLACGDGAALSHMSAAALWGIWRRRVSGLDVTAPRQRRARARDPIAMRTEPRSA